MTIYLQNKKNTNSAENNAVTSPPKKPSVPKIINNNDNKKKQHDALMDEFKKVHRKMFANQDDTTAKEGTETEANSLVSTNFVTSKIPVIVTANSATNLSVSHSTILKSRYHINLFVMNI